MTTDKAYVGDPSENVRMEREVILRDVESTLNEDVALQCATIV